jgi:hypothetical protein
VDARAELLEVRGRIEARRHLPGKHDQSTHGRRKVRLGRSLADFDKALRSAITGRLALESPTFGLSRRPRPAEFTLDLSGPVYEYSGWTYKGINAHLRGQPLQYGLTTAEMKPLVRGIDKTMRNSKLRHDVEVYRGLSDASTMFGDRLKGDLAGMVWQEDAYTSTSALERRARMFANPNGNAPMLMRILAPAGTPAVELSDEDLEAEILLGRRRKLRVVRDRGTNAEGIREIDVEVIA